MVNPENGLKGLTLFTKPSDHCSSLFCILNLKMFENY